MNQDVINQATGRGVEPKNHWQEFFDQHAPQYNENCFTKNTLAEVDFLIEVLELKPGAALLDIGCGTGRHAIELARRGYSVTGVDLSAGMLQQARQGAQAAGVTARWVQANATAFALEQPVDAAICLCEGAFGLLSQGDDSLEQPLAILRCAAQAMKPSAKCLFTVLNGYAMIRRRTQEDVQKLAFDPLTLAEVSECQPVPGSSAITVRERAFVPTELKLLFQNAGLQVLNIWGGTAGNWGRRPIELDEIELMVLARKPA